MLFYCCIYSTSCAVKPSKRPTDSIRKVSILNCKIKTKPVVVFRISTPGTSEWRPKYAEIVNQGAGPVRLIEEIIRNQGSKYLDVIIDTTEYKNDNLNILY